MRGSVAKLSAIVLSFGSLSRAAVECNSNITIANAQDAQEVRDNCRVIEGDIHLEANLTETIDLDGVEVVKGGVGMSCVNHDKCPPLEQHFNITSSTLQEIGGSLYIYRIGGLRSIVLPKLHTIEGGLRLLDLANLTNVDLTDLEYTTNVMWDTAALESLAMPKFKGRENPDPESPFLVQLDNVGLIDSVDAFFQDPMSLEPGYSSALSLVGEHMPKVRKVNLAWQNLTGLGVSGDDLTVVLGGPKSKSMKVGDVVLSQGTVHLERNDALEQLNVGDIKLVNNPGITELNLPFDAVSSLDIDNCPKLTSITLPPEAKNWQNFTLHIKGSSVNLATEPGEDSNTTWYWPENDMHSVEIYGDIAADFFDSLPQVTTSLTVTDYSGRLDCDKFRDKYEAKHKLPRDYNCSQLGAAGSLRALGSPLLLGVASLVTFVLMC